MTVDTSGSNPIESGITVGELREKLRGHADDYPVCFGPQGHFSFYQVRDREGSLQIVFREVPGEDYVLTPQHRLNQRPKA